MTTAGTREGAIGRALAYFDDGSFEAELGRRVAYRTEVVEGEQMNRIWAIIAALTSGIALSSPASAQELTPSAINASAEENLTQAQARSAEVKKVMAAVERANDTVALERGDRTTSWSGTIRELHYGRAAQRRPST